jgi:hypothetical protein
VVVKTEPVRVPLSTPPPKPIADTSEKLSVEEMKLYSAQVQKILNDAFDPYHFQSKPGHRDRVDFVKKLQDMIATGRRPITLGPLVSGTPWKCKNKPTAMTGGHAV